MNSRKCCAWCLQWDITIAKAEGAGSGGEDNCKGLQRHTNTHQYTGKVCPLEDSLVFWIGEEDCRVSHTTS